MPIVTRIVQQKDQNRVSVYLDGKFAFGVTLESLLSNHLKVGQELSGGQIDTLKEQSNQDKVFTRVLRFVTSRPHSEREIKLWFKKKKVDEVVQGVALNRLTKLGLVDDLAFAKWWIEQRNTFRPKPIRVLKMELRQKGVSSDVIEEALGGSESPSELETARKVVAKKAERFLKMPYEERKKRLSNFLAMRGFSWEVIKKIVDELN